MKSWALYKIFAEVILLNLCWKKKKKTYSIDVVDLLEHSSVVALMSFVRRAFHVDAIITNHMVMQDNLYRDGAR